MIWSSAISAFLASVVEFVEALTIVLVVGVTINWKSALAGTAAAAVTLALLVAVFGTALVVFIPIEILRLIVGIILVLFGLKWLKKAILRYSGQKALHDEEAIYEEEMRAMKARGEVLPDKIDGFGFATAYKSVLLEGLEVAFIVITFGTSAATTDQEKTPALVAAASGALAAGLLVLVIGSLIRGPLTQVPENTLKFCVGIMLASFGTFWAGEGLGIEWPGTDLFLLALIGAYLLVSFLLVSWLRALPPKSKSRGTHRLIDITFDRNDPTAPLREEELK
jgi:Ca2+/H+ antiporter, TMEM165/GDT1 family